MKKTFVASFLCVVLLFSFTLVGCMPPVPPAAPGVEGVVFEGISTVYNGEEQRVEATEVPEGVTVEYENNAYTDAGEYEATAYLYYNSKLIKELSAQIVIAPKAATVVIDDKQSMIDNMQELTYTAEGVIEGDDLGVTLTVQKNTSGIKQIEASYTNPNYNVTFEGGAYTITEYLFDSSALTGYSSNFLPNYAPFSLYDTTHFAETVVTSISFPYYGLASGYTVDSANLFMPVYVVKNDFTTKQADCTEANGKKLNLDFTGKLSGVKQGDWLTVDGLNLVVGENETLAFGDKQMAVLPMFKRNDGSYGFWNMIFANKGKNNHSLVFKIAGYSTKAPVEDPVTPPDDGKTYISFLGDSITTYNSWSNNTSFNNTIGGNAIWYPNNNYTGANLAVEKTWWHMTAAQLGYELCVNNSWSGSVVNNTQTYNVRAKNLHNTSNNTTPDVIVILIGVNDFAANTAVGDYNGTTTAPSAPANFSQAYGRMLANIKEAYPEAEVYCCTFLPDRKRTQGSNGVGISETAYNAAITQIANNMGVNVIDLYTLSGFNTGNITSYTVDKLHPNEAGMEIMKNVVVNAIRANA